jgi:hypothetical protein
MVPILLGIVAFFEYLELGGSSVEAANIAGPIAVGIICAWSALRILYLAPALFLSCKPWVLISAAAYYGFGPLVHIYGNSETINSYPKNLAIRPEQLLQTNILNAVFLAILTLTYVVLSRKRFSSATTMSQIVHNLADHSAAKTLLFLCLVVGFPVRILLSVPNEFGMFEAHIPNTILRLGTMTTLALIPCCYLAGVLKGRFMLLAVVLLSLELSWSLISFSKSAILICILFSGVGFYLANQTRNVLVSMFLVLLFAYFAVAPLVRISRQESINRTGAYDAATLSERVQIVEDLFNDENSVWTNRNEDKIQYGWRRFSYAPVQSFVMKRYHNGQPLDFYKNALWAFVPRIIAPDKPNMTEMGIELNYMISGHRTSQTGVGVAGEAYGVGGPFAVVFIAMAIGSIFAFLDSRFAFSQSGGWLFLPVQLIGMRMGYRLDGAFVPDYLGSLVIVIGYTQIVRLFLLTNLWKKQS